MAYSCRHPEHDPSREAGLSHGNQVFFYVVILLFLSMGSAYKYKVVLFTPIKRLGKGFQLFVFYIIKLPEIKYPLSLCVLP